VGAAGTRVAFGDVIPPSAAGVSADLAGAALGSPALARAYKLARWLGPGRKLTSDGALRPGAVAEACWALGISPPGTQLPGAPDVEEFMQDWATAVDAGFVVIYGRHACGYPGGPARPEPRSVHGGNRAAY
jgi:hypothetical protein